jgi:uncharacterized membrane protein YdfJ with MMPL/SSD domain
VFASFALSDERALRIFGLGMATAVLIDATVVRLVLVPSVMQLLGRVVVAPLDGAAASTAALRDSADRVGGGLSEDVSALDDATSRWIVVHPEG